MCGLFLEQVDLQFCFLVVFLATFLTCVFFSFFQRLKPNMFVFFSPRSDLWAVVDLEVFFFTFSLLYLNE